MGKIFMLTGANIRKGKSQTVSLIIFVLLAAMFLNIGLVLYLDFTEYFDKHAEELNAPHFIALQEEGITTEEQLKWLEGYTGVTQVEKQSVVSGMGEYYLNGSKSVGVVIFANINDEQKMDSASLIGESLPREEDFIYVPYLMKVAGGYELGDSYTLNLSGTELNFTIAGFTEEITYGALMNQLYRFYVSDEMYTKLLNKFPDDSCYLQSVRLEDSTLATELQTDYMQEFFYQEGADDTSSTFLYAMDYTNAIKQARTFIPLITAMLLFAFAIIILVVSLIVIRFGIINNIEQNMSNIGVLKAAGFKNNQITSSIILQFCSIAFVGSLLGIIASQMVLPVISSALETQSSLIWKPEIYYIKAVISLVSVFALVLIVSFMVTKKIYKLHPLIALRGGIETHNFKKNYLPLEKSHGPLSLLLAAKGFLQSKRQGVMIAIIVAFLSFASIVAISTYYNVGVEKDAFGRMIAGEVPDAALVLKDSNDSEGVANRLREREDVRKIFGYQNVTMLVDETKIQTIVSDDFSQFEGTTLYEGRYPKHSNEVAISNNVAAVSGKAIGDTILVEQGSEKKEFVITGMIQLISNGGFNIAMTYDGILTLQEDFQFSQMYIYLTDGTDAKAFIKDIENSEGDIFTTTIEMEELVEAQLSQYGDIFAAVAAIILIITVIVVVLVLYLVIKTTILRRKRDFGIQKAIGFTTIQLMNQVAMNYTPLIIIGIGIGGIAGYFSMNPLISALLKSVGVMNANMSPPTDWTVFTSIILIVLAYLVSMLVSWRIRKISAYSLLTE